MSPVHDVRKRALLFFAAGALVGFLAGWLVFGRVSVDGRGAPEREPTRPSPEAAELAESVRALSEAVERLAAAKAAAKAERPTAVLPEKAAPGGEPPRIAPGVKFHNTFEKGTEGWFVARFAPEVIGEIRRTGEEGQAKEGKGALALSYTLEPGKIPLAVRMANPINRLSLWIRALKRPAELVVGVTERDDSFYQTMEHLDPADGWRHLDLDLAHFTLSDDSKDENGRLDFHQIETVHIIDAAGFLGGRGENTLLIDDVTGEYRAEDTPAPGGEGERF